MKKAQGRSKIITRRFVLGVGVAVFLFMNSDSAHAIERMSINFDYVKERARQLAEKPHEEVVSSIPDFLRALDYNTYLDVRSDPRKALWADEQLPFCVTFSLPGYIYDYAVTVHEFTATHVQEVPFAPHFFDFGSHAELAARIPPSLGYAGLHIFYPLNHVERPEEIAVFLGSDYYRVVGRGAKFGISARGLAINTAPPQPQENPEEFPVFREFWLGKPHRRAETLVVYALLDGPSVTGAYRFDITPGYETEIAVKACLFFRRQVRHVGLAPFSSMFYFNENCAYKPPDYRPQVHDSDGLLIRRPDGAYIWQPLINPADRLVSKFRFQEAAAFGLCQRDRKFENYQDIDQAYQRRPSVWVEPGKGDWGAGSVVLYTFGVNSETIDNVVAFWQPRKPPPVGVPFSIDYTITYSRQERSPEGYVVATRTGGPIGQTDLHQYIVDFDGEELRTLEAIDRLRAVVNASAGIRLEEPIVVKNPFDKTWRLILQFRVADEAPEKANLTAYLTHRGQRVTETWSYIWTKERQFPPIPQQQVYGTKPTEE